MAPHVQTHLSKAATTLPVEGTCTRGQGPGRDLAEALLGHEEDQVAEEPRLGFRACYEMNPKQLP